ncbi:MAG: PspC domain-containing protein [Bacteroidia bacterium]|nr:PspC domain-containing protein [Bacteroidia bacterium]
MKKSIKINLGGLVLHVDDDAYELLRNYLDQLQARFRQVPGESEILNDIETRMAELFQEKLVPGKEVINLADAKEVIEVMGKPEEIGDAGEEESGPAMPPPYSGRGRRMYRDTSNQRIAGVCSGLAAYFKIDPLIIRILFVVFSLAYGAGILIYFVLWVGVPEARTAAEKLEMYGEPVNVYNIERQVRQEYPYDPAAPDYEQPVRRSSQGTLIGRVVRVFAKIILVFFKIIGFIIAFSFIVAGIAILGSIIGLAVSGKAWFVNSDWNLNNIGLNDALGFFVSPTAATIGMIGLILLVVIPLIGLIYGVVKVIFRFKAREKVGALSLSGIWVITLIVMIVIAINEGIQYSSEGRSTVEKELVIPQSKKLIIRTLPMPIDMTDHMAEFDFHSNFWISRQNDSVSLVIRPTVRIEYSEDSIPGIRIRKTARGVNYRDARGFAEDINYSCTLQDSVLIVDPAYRLSQSNRYHAQEVEVTVDLPAGTIVYLDKSLKDILYAVQNTEDTWSGDLVGDEWIMTPDGLTRVLKK